ncbi:DUF6286 domain-containing protein [Phytohabitans houttuyneae]|uniref:DUF6286 domain-containing protein n=1 Tax=Phytohabitans houttuyneae TaxID=1076126 RepID=A0A6V8L0M2_9ACTN|nr:DUF6286 domain-containing protein [Phytohabitans houttuyneae]GFJ86275.1 hypothetical protein Phou_104550 [Phytohabitans houttuyneae]
MPIVNRIASLLLGLALLAAGLLAVVEAALVGLDRPALWVPRDDWYARLTTTGWRDSSVLFVAVVAGALGLLILLAQLRPWRPDRIATYPHADSADGAQDPSWYLQRRSVEHRLAAAAERVPGVRDAQAVVRGRPRRWRAAVKAAGDRETRPDVEQAVRAELERMSAPDTVRLGVSLTRIRRVT